MRLGRTVCPMRYKTGNSCQRNVTLSAGTAPLTRCVLVFAPCVPLFAWVDVASRQCQFQLPVASSEALTFQRRNLPSVGHGRSGARRCARLRSNLLSLDGRPVRRGSALKHLASHARRVTVPAATTAQHRLGTTVGFFLLWQAPFRRPRCAWPPL